MNKITVLALVCAIALAACLPAPVSTNPTAVMDVAGTVNAIAGTANAQTLTAQPSPTFFPALDTATPLVADASATPTETVIVNTDTPQPNLTTTPSTATSGPDVPGFTFTPTAGSGSTSPTLTPTLGVLTYGTLPPSNRPFMDVTLVNKAKRQAYISLQVLTDQGYTIIEYPVKGFITIKAPTGEYTYVVWVGGRQIVGYFKLGSSNDLTITIYKDKVTISHGSASYP
ncbi:MAG: hypothetical protein ABI904_11845 [Chloroflexota bacterium]